MNFIRNLLYKLLGKSLYFRLVSKSFLLLYQTGILAVWNNFKTHYLVSNLIKKGDTIIDIGANFGYYTSIFAKKAGKEGKVYAVEPVPDYRSILRSNTRRFSNIEILPFALSNIEGQTEMGIPSELKYRHGLIRIIDKSEGNANINTYSVLTKTPDSLFSDINGLDYIKCDIEGHEDKVIPEFRNLIDKFRPLIQIELENSNFEIIDPFLKAFGYKSFVVRGNKLYSLHNGELYSSDIIYIPDSRINEFSRIINYNQTT